MLLHVWIPYVHKLTTFPHQIVQIDDGNEFDDLENTIFAVICVLPEMLIAC